MMGVLELKKTNRRVKVTPIVGYGLLYSCSIALIWYVRRHFAVPVYAAQIEVATAQAMPYAIGSSALRGSAPLQILTTGTGPLYVRSYQVDLVNPAVDAETLMQNIVENINCYSPQALARFEKVKGDPDHIAVGDEYFIHITGPWNGPVRVIDVTPTSFTFVTLKGHLEAGEINFSVTDHPELSDALRFRIQSWARSSNMVTDLFYRVLGISQLAQTTMWTYFCEQAVEHSGGERPEKIEIMTHKTDVKNAIDPLPEWKLYSSQLERWSKTDLNFDINMSETFTEANGWRIDDYSIGLPGEEPGPPAPDGAFEAAKQIIRNYEFPDPSLITGIFVPDGPLENRVMVLRARFWFFTFLFGVRVGKVIDEVRRIEKPGTTAYVWGYSYRTLKGHFEMGEITFEVWKYEQTGEVRFRVHAYSKPDRISNPFYRIGFKIFGRSLQLRFARTATLRMQQLVLERLVAPVSKENAVPTPEVQPIEESEKAQDKAEEVKDQTSP
jgi:uncharacterized protein (UPF0548 family)